MNLPDADIEVLVRTDNPENPLVIGYWDGFKWCLAGNGVENPIEPQIGTVTGWADTDAAVKQVKWNV